MHLFGRHDEPHLTRVEAHRMPRYVTLAWDVRHAPALTWRVLRSETDFADDAGADAVVGSGQTLISESATPGSRDDAVTEGITYFYTVFSQDAQGDWARQVKVKLERDDHLRLERSEPGDFEEASPADGYLDANAVYAEELYVAKALRGTTGKALQDPVRIGTIGGIYKPAVTHVPTDV